VAGGPSAGRFQVDDRVFLILHFSSEYTGGGAQVQSEEQKQGNEEKTPGFRPAAFEFEEYLPLLREKRVALLVNHTSTVGEVHLVDTLLSLGVDVRKIFAPEHGFRGTADAGATISDGRDRATGLPIVSLYGKNKKPTPRQLEDIDVVLFDIQDVGARFYTYISTLFYVMEAVGEQKKTLIVLDRPNPNGHYVDGPVLTPDNKSFVGIAPIPVVHGLTVAEFAMMASGEGWLAAGTVPQMEIITMPGYTHAQAYELPTPPSPNLPNQRSIYLYPSLCFFEGTAVSVGRGTNLQFQIYGHPDLSFGDLTFAPEPGPGSKHPKLEGKLCRGVSFADFEPELIREQGRLSLKPLLKSHADFKTRGIKFFTRPDFFDLLAGGPGLRQAIERGATEDLVNSQSKPKQYVDPGISGQLGGGLPLPQKDPGGCCHHARLYDRARWQYGCSRPGRKTCYRH